VPAVPADRPQLAQVVGNLIKNASEAFGEERKPGKRYIRVITAYDEHSREVTVTVMDNGSGIPPDLQKNIFSPFYTNKAEGTGLGLTFSRQVVEAHGGDIGFDSAEGQGTKFTVRLPVFSAPAILAESAPGILAGGAPGILAGGTPAMLLEARSDGGSEWMHKHAARQS
jgi:two-component system sensor histidine kinase DctS